MNELYVVNWHIETHGGKYPDDYVTWTFVAHLTPEEVIQLHDEVNSRYGQSLIINPHTVMSFEQLKSTLNPE